MQILNESFFVVQACNLLRLGDPSKPNFDCSVPQNPSSYACTGNLEPHLDYMECVPDKVFRDTIMLQLTDTWGLQLCPETAKWARFGKHCSAPTPGDSNSASIVAQWHRQVGCWICLCGTVKGNRTSSWLMDQWIWWDSLQDQQQLESRLLPMKMQGCLSCSARHWRGSLAWRWWRVSSGDDWDILQSWKEYKSFQGFKLPVPHIL